MGTRGAKGHRGCGADGGLRHWVCHHAQPLCLTKCGCGLQPGPEGRVECLWKRMLGLRVCTRGERWWGQSCKGALQECMCRRKQERKPGMCESRAGRNMGESQKNNVRVCEKERERECVCVCVCVSVCVRACM